MNQTRQKIITATSHLLERQGYHATGLKQILKESGAPRGSLYYYFPDGKEELAAEAITLRMIEIAEHSRQLLSHVDEPAEAFSGMILHFAGIMEQQGCVTGAPIAAVALEASSTSERLRKACEAGYEEMRAVLAAKLVMSGYSAETAASLATTINAAIEGATILGRTQQNAQPLVNVANAVKTLIQATPKK